MKRQINIIPADYQGNPRNALGYCWQDYENQIPGDDRIGGYDTFLAVKAELEADGLVCLSPEVNWPEGAELVARVDCMWCGGASLLAYRIPVGEIEAGEPISANPGEEPQETATIVAMQDRIAEMELDAEYAKRPGWCKKCHSFCYGDCEAGGEA